jgi:ATP adenylyltransferase
LERLWAPWRVDYVTGEQPKGCVFCRKLASDDDAANHVLHRGEHNALLVNTFPYNSGHLMVVPLDHVAELTDLAPAARAEMMELTVIAGEALKRALCWDGLNVGINVGRAAGAGISDHIHLHIVPRWEGDTNFMSTVFGTRIVPQSLDACYEQLAPIVKEVAEEQAAKGEG